jgi:hypothetical protein
MTGFPKNFNKFAAINSYQWNALGAGTVCGKCVRLWYGERSTVVQIVDLCPSCAMSMIDISHAAMADLYGTWSMATQQGLAYNVKWTQVDCSQLSTDKTFRGSNYVVGSS